MTEEEIADKIDEWHNGNGVNQELHEYLGWTEDQYAVWIYCSVIFDPSIAEKLASSFSPKEIQTIKETIIKDNNGQK